MPVEITAEFETPDMADFALAALRLNNVELHSYTVRAARPSNQKQKPFAAEATGLWPFGETAVPYEEPSEVILTAIVPEDKAGYARELWCGAHGLRIR